MPGEDACADMGLVESVGRNLFIAFIDAAGHGPVAHLSGVRALEFLKNQCMEMELDELVVALHYHMEKHRGVVAALCWLNLDDGMLRHVAMGNIVSRIYGPCGHEFISSTGLIGSWISPHHPREEARQMHHHDLLVLHSDGISSRARVTQVPGLIDANVSEVASTMVEEYGRQTDDASCLALRYCVE